MSKRVELKLDEMEMVVGGRFTYNTHQNEDGSEYMTCRVDDIGTFYCKDNAKQKISVFFLNNPDATAQDGVDYALQKGYFWN